MPAGWRDAERWLQAALDADLPLRPRSRLLLSFGHLAALQGDLMRGSALMADAYEDARLLGDDLFVVRVLASRVMVARYGGHYGQALELLEQALDRVEPLGTPERARALELEYAEVLDELGRTDEAVPVWLECRRWAIASDNMVQLAYLLGDLGVAALEGFDVSEAADGTEQGQVARVLASQAVAAAQQSDSISVRADILVTAGLIDLRTGATAEVAGPVAGRRARHPQCRPAPDPARRRGRARPGAAGHRRVRGRHGTARHRLGVAAAAVDRSGRAVAARTGGACGVGPLEG